MPPTLTHSLRCSIRQFHSTCQKKCLVNIIVVTLPVVKKTSVTQIQREKRDSLRHLLVELKYIICSRFVQAGLYPSNRVHYVQYTFTDGARSIMYFSSKTFWPKKSFFFQTKRWRCTVNKFIVTIFGEKILCNQKWWKNFM